MRNRFSRKHFNPLTPLVRTIPFIAFLILFCCFCVGVNSVNHTTRAKQQENLETALSRSIAQCYAIEGMYPPNLEYLEKHYGLSYDKNTFLVDYQPSGSSITPKVTVSLRTFVEQ